MKSVKLASILFYLNSVFVVSCFVSCGSSPTEASSLLTADIRGGMDKPGLLELGDEIKGVTFVPLEVTTDDASLIDGVYDYAVTDRYIYVLPVKEPRIVLFDRQGRFIRTLVKEGQGPGEFSGILPCIQVDERNDRLFLFSNNRVWEYTLEGEFIGQSTHEYSVIYMRHIGKDRFAAISFPFQPFNGGGFGLGLFSRKGDTIAIKNDFYSFLLPHEKSGFTTSIAPAYSDAQNSVLFKTGSNDTVFCISADRISAACVLDLKNSDAEVIRSLDVTDMSNLRIEKKDPKDIFVQDMIEFPAHYYFRLLYNQGYYIASVDKKTGKTLVEKCEMPGSIYELADANLQHGMQGTRSYRNFPVWGRVIKDELVQVVTPYELNLYKSLHSITIPQEFIGAVIGPGGKVIQEIQKQTGTTITITEKDNKGYVDIFGEDKGALDSALARIKEIVAIPEVGEVYNGKIRSIVAFGAFVEILPGKDGLLHISEIGNKRYETMEETGLKEGDMIEVKLIGIDPKNGKLKLSRKVLLPGGDKSEERSERHEGRRHPRRDDKREEKK